MTAHRTVIAQFCDDVRQEIGNKFSLMGCYGADLYVPAFPITLPKLCVFVHVRTVRATPFQRLTLRLMRGREVLSELVANPDKLNTGETPEWARWLSMTGILAVTPFHAAGPCRLQVLAETESETLESGQFLIERMRQDPQQQRLG
ncbi:MAG: DUF6941 family protein [Steroidobacteraceae bacterium]